MFLIAHVDDHFHIDELAILTKIARAFGFDDRETERLRVWAQAEGELVRELQALVDDA